MRKPKGKTMLKVIGIDPGLTGAIVVTDGENFLETYSMPLHGPEKERRVSFEGIRKILTDNPEGHIFLERAVSFAMGTKGAFHYGMDFGTVLNVIRLLERAFTLVEPNKWTREMHQGVDQQLKAKVRSAIAVERLYPKLTSKLPRKPKGALLDGPVDALLIAGYGLRGRKPLKPAIPDLTDFDFF